MNLIIISQPQNLAISVSLWTEHWVGVTAEIFIFFQFTNVFNRLVCLGFLDKKVEKFIRFFLFFVCGFLCTNT